MPLDPQLQRYLDENPLPILPSVRTLTPQAVRIAARTLYHAEAAGEVEAVACVEDRQIPVSDGTITVRIYTPAGAGPFPILVYYHGGGFVLGDLDAYDPPCRQIANHVPCIVVSVAYRLAPEYPFPTAVEDGYAALRWVAEQAPAFHGDPARLGVAGDSAGGTIAAAATLMAKDRGGPRACVQVLLYPPVDFVTPRPVTGSAADDLADHLHEMYLVSESAGHHPYASPLLADDFTGLPDAVIMTAELDRLRHEGERYAEKLREAGVPVDYFCYAGLTHGFINLLGVLDQAKDAIQRISGALQTAFGTANAADT